MYTDWINRPMTIATTGRRIQRGRSIVVVAVAVFVVVTSSSSSIPNASNYGTSAFITSVALQRRQQRQRYRRSSTNSDDMLLSSIDFNINDFQALDDDIHSNNNNDDTIDDDDDVDDVDKNSMTISQNENRNVNTYNDDGGRSRYFGTDDENDDEDETALFLKMIEATPRGQLNDDELETVRDILSSIRESIVLEGEGGDKIDVDTPFIVERLLLRWVEEYKVRQNCYIIPSTDDFVTVMKLWERLIGTNRRRINTEEIPTAIEHIKTLLSVVKECYHHQTSNDNINHHSISLQPNLNIYRIVLRSLSYSTERQVDRKGEKIFFEMQTEYRIYPDVSCYESLIYMLAKSRNDGAAHRAERLLRDAVATLQQQQQTTSNDKNNNNNDNKSMIGIETFNVVITAWAKSGIEYGPERAEQLIHLMSEIDVEPNIHTFTSLIDAYAQGNTWDSASQCERIFNRVLDMYLNFNDDKDNDEKFSLEPGIVSWSVVVSAWGRLAKNGHRGASDRADKLLRRMETLYQERRITYGPDPMLYVKCMNANACSQTVEGLHRASQILNEMYERYMDGNDEYMPTARSIHVLIDNWIRSQLPKKMDEAEAIFNMYKDHIFDNVPDSLDKQTSLSATYKSMVIGWALDGDPILAQECLEEMIEKDVSSPESICFEKIIDANTQLIVDDKYAMKRSYTIFQLLEECRMQHHDFVPNERAYTAFIRAMTKGHVPNLAQKSYSILQKLEELHRQGNNESIMPTVFTYNAVLLACAESASLTSDIQQQRETLRAAVTIFNNLRQGNLGSCQLDSVSFGNMLRCSNLLSTEDSSSSSQKDEFITSIFQLCCEGGLVNYFILRDLFMVASDDLKEKLLGTNMPLDDAILEQLPSSWQRNANNNKKAMNKTENTINNKDSFQKGNRRSKPFQAKRR